MKLIVSGDTDVYFNLAAEDYFLYETHEDVLMLWRSKSAVVCGKHQNLCAELNYGYCKTHGIQVARRLSGGGTVYHDLGNINFSFIHNVGEKLEKAIDFKRYILPVQSFLHSLNVKAEISARNDLFIGDNKISGNAEHIFQKNKRVIHHGTLLFDSDLQNLGAALKPDGKFTDKAVKSVRSPVCNISEFTNGLNTATFMEAMADYFVKQQGYARYTLNVSETAKIAELQKTKYETKDWILGYSPKYSVEKRIEINSAEYELHMEIEKGSIKKFELRLNGKHCYEKESEQMTGRELSEKTANHFFEMLDIPSNPYVFF